MPRPRGCAARTSAIRWSSWCTRMQGIAPGCRKLCRIGTRGGRNPLTGESVDFGGTPEGNAESTLDAIPKVLAFLNDALNSSGQ